MAERDEDLAKRLQTEYDAEAVLYQRQLIEDHEIAAVMSQYQDLSDSDAIVAKRLQAEFDAEAVLYQRQPMIDHKTAAVMSQFQDLSDSDSDAIVEPADLSSFHIKNSPHLTVGTMADA